MIEVTKQKEPTQQQIIKLLDEKPQLPPIAPCSSTFHKDYQQFFDGIEDTMPLERMIELLYQEKIRYIPERDHTLFSIHATDLNISYELATLLVELGPFDLTLTLLNNINKNYTHYLKGNASTFATIYQYSTSQPQSVIKCTAFRPKDFHDCLVNIAKEYSLLKIAGVLGVGPKATKAMGFDLVAYTDCIEFSMQKCLEIKQMDDGKRKKIKQKVKRLHKLNIVHADIKPQNLCLSPISRQPIFIDFGLSEVIQQIPGQTTHTFFTGSLNYCSKQMSQLYYQSTSGPVDLYYNDTLCLTRSLAEIACQNKENVLVQGECGQESEGEGEVYLSVASVGYIENSFMLLRVKSLLYNSQAISQQFASNRKFIMNNKQKLIFFIKTLNYSVLVDYFCQVILASDRDKLLLDSLIKCIKYNSSLQEEKEKIHLPDDNEDDIDVLKKIKKQDQHLDQNYQMLLARMREMVDGMQVKIIYTSKKELSIDMAVQTLLDSPHLIAKLSGQDYFRKFIHFTDLRNGKGSKVKQTIVNIMLQYLKASQHSDKRKLDKLGFCWHQLLMHYLNIQSQFTVQAISALFHNLMIVEYYSEQQILELILQCGRVSVKNHVQRYELLYFCFTALLWTKHRIPSRYRNTFFDKCSEAFCLQLKKIEPYIMQQFTAAFYIVCLFEAASYGISKQITGILDSISGQQNYLSNQAFYDLKITLVNLVLQQPERHFYFERWNSCLHTQAIFENRLKVKHKFSHYHFRIQDIALRMSQHKILQKINANFKICFEDVGLSQVFRLTRNQQITQQMRDNGLIAKQIENLTVQNLMQNAPLIFQIEDILHQSQFYKPKYTALVGFIKNKFTYEFLMSIDVGRHSSYLQDVCHSFSALNVLFRLFGRFNIDLKGQYKFEKQFDNLYIKIHKEYDENWKEKDEQGHISWSINDTTAIYLLHREEYQQALEQYTRLLAHSFDYKKFQNSYYLFTRIYYVITTYIRDSSLKMHYTQLVYSLWSKSKGLVRLFRLPPSVRWIYSFTRFLMIKSRLKEVISLHLNIIQKIEQALKPQFIEKYIRQTYLYVRAFPLNGRRLIEAIKSLRKSRFYQLKQFGASCVCLTLLGRQVKYDANSRRILKISLDKFSLVKDIAKVMLSEILYRYLLIRGTEYNAMGKQYLKFQLDHQFVGKLKKDKSRQKALWLRRLNQVTQFSQVKLFPVSLLIKRYTKDCPQHKLFKQFLIKIRRYADRNFQIQKK